MNIANLFNIIINININYLILFLNTISIMKIEKYTIKILFTKSKLRNAYQNKTWNISIWYYIGYRVQHMEIKYDLYSIFVLIMKQVIASIIIASCYNLIQSLIILKYIYILYINGISTYYLLKNMMVQLRIIFSKYLPNWIL